MHGVGIRESDDMGVRHHNADELCHGLDPEEHIASIFVTECGSGGRDAPGCESFGLQIAERRED